MFFVSHNPFCCRSMSLSYAVFSPIQRCCFAFSIAVAPLEAVDYQTAASSHLVHVGLSAFRSTIGIRHDVSQGSGLDLGEIKQDPPELWT
jgi:hypothetical protein